MTDEQATAAATSKSGRLGWIVLESTLLASLLAALVAGYFSYKATSEQIAGAAELQQKQLADIRDQMKLQEASQQRLQDHQDQLALKQIEVQAKFARDLAEMQLKYSREAELRQERHVAFERCNADEQALRDARQKAVQEIDQRFNAFFIANFSSYSESKRSVLQYVALRSGAIEKMVPPGTNLYLEVQRVFELDTNAIVLTGKASDARDSLKYAIRAAARLFPPETKAVIDKLDQQVPPLMGLPHGMELSRPPVGKTVELSEAAELLRADEDKELATQIEMAGTFGAAQADLEAAAQTYSVAKSACVTK